MESGDGESDLGLGLGGKGAEGSQMIFFVERLVGAPLLPPLGSSKRGNKTGIPWFVDLAICNCCWLAATLHPWKGCREMGSHLFTFVEQKEHYPTSRTCGPCFMNYSRSKDGSRTRHLVDEKVELY